MHHPAEVKTQVQSLAGLPLGRFQHRLHLAQLELAAGTGSSAADTPAADSMGADSKPRPSSRWYHEQGEVACRQTLVYPGSYRGFTG